MAVEFDERKIDAVFADLDQCHLPGAAVGVAIGGRPVYRKGFGLASMELPVVLSPTTRMRIQSVSKHFTCLAYLLLCEDGVAGLDDELGKYFPELHPVTHKVTMRQLMGHTSGLYDAHTIRYLFSGMEREVQTFDLIALYRDIDQVNFPPGTSWSYNNGGYGLLSVAIERITGQPLEEVLRERIFVPTGMHDTMLRRFGNDMVPGSATNHSKTTTGDFKRADPVGALVGNGGIISTIDDMLRWLAHMDAPAVGSAATWDTMSKPMVLPNGTSTRYGLGLLLGRYRGVEIIGHGGNTNGSNSKMLKVPSAGLDIQVMVNRDDVSAPQFAERILDVCLPDLDPVADPFGGPFVTGAFRSSRTGRVLQLRAPAAIPPLYPQRRQISSLDGLDLHVEPDDNGVLSEAGMTSPWRWTVTLQGEHAALSSIQLNYFGDIDDLLPVEPVDDPDVAAIVGCYRSEMSGTEAVIAETPDGPSLHTVGQFGSADFKLECIGRDTWRAQSLFWAMGPWSSILSFDPEHNTFRFATPQLRSVIFHRQAMVGISAG
jgi:CubicO group peptidase (beta-lactamase class C family)